MWSISLLPALLVSPGAALAPPPPQTSSTTRPRAEGHHRQFDFWIGEWSVLNHHMSEEGEWRVGDTTRARITPVCGGSAILEEWAGPFHGTFMNGFSLRAYDPERKDWELLLFWTTDGRSSFGRLRGSFRHGRGEFFDRTDGALRTRYSFSDALPTTVRWDSATTKDGGISWKTDWIMEFSRTRPAAEVTLDELLRTDWAAGQLSPDSQARQLDWMLGDWTGVQEASDGGELEARLRCKLLDKDCLVLEVLETRAAGADDWDERVTVRGFEARPGSWAAWTVAERDTVLRGSRGKLDDDAMVFEREEKDGTTVTERLEPEGGQVLRILVTRVAPDGTVSMTGTTLERTKSGR